MKIFNTLLFLALTIVAGQSQAQIVVKGIKCADSVGATHITGPMFHRYRGPGTGLITVQVVRDRCRPKGVGNFILATFNTNHALAHEDIMVRKRKYSSSMSREGVFNYSWVVRFNPPPDTRVGGTFDYFYAITTEP